MRADAEEDVLDGLSLPGDLTRQRLVGHHGERPQVAAMIERVEAARLLGAHIARRPEDHVLAGRERRARPERLRRARDAEVEELHEQAPVLVLREEHVRGLEIAVEDLLGVGLAERACHLHHDRGGLREIELAASLDARLERLAFEQLHHEVREAVLLAVVADGDDVPRLSRELRRDLRFELEAARGAFVLLVLRGLHQLDGELAAERVVGREPYLAHRALADQANELVLPRDHPSDVDLREH